MSVSIAAKLFKGSEADVERLVRSGRVEAKTLESGARVVHSGQVISFLRAKRAEEIERRLASREPYERDAGYVVWFDDRTGREIRADARQSFVDTAPLMLDVMPPGVFSCPTPYRPQRAALRGMPRAVLAAAGRIVPPD